MLLVTPELVEAHRRDLMALASSRRLGDRWSLQADRSRRQHRDNH